MERDDEPRLGVQLGQPGDRLGDPLQPTPPGLPAVRGHHDDARRLVVLEVGDPRVLVRRLPARGPLERIDRGVAGHEDALVVDALEDEVALVRVRRGEVERRETRQQLAVRLLGERREPVLGPRPRLDVHHRDAQVERGQRRGDRRRRVTEDEACDGAARRAPTVADHLLGHLRRAADLLDAEQDRREELVERELTRPPDPEVHVLHHVGLAQQVVDVLGVLPGADDHRTEPPVALQRMHDGNHLGCLGTGPDDDENLGLVRAVRHEGAP
ncbi:hypothetical protein GALL_457410 [mine drainage metagenome]|uniref:Uncharacterized protein n=1 Tax=mine drainage metagenome TaxID=410659 RepID=A0A1J5Q9H1_9ZZZZ